MENLIDYALQTKFEKVKKLKNNLPVVFEDDNNKIYFNQSYLPRAFMVYTYHVFKNKEEILIYLKNEKTNLGKMVALEEAPSHAINTDSKVSGKESDVIFEKYTPHLVELEVSAPESGLLVLTDNYFPSWQALVDDKPTKILRADYAFRAVTVPKGKHNIKFIYRPRSFTLGLVASCIFIFVGLTIILYLLKIKKAVL